LVTRLARQAPPGAMPNRNYIQQLLAKTLLWIVRVGS